MPNLHIKKYVYFTLAEAGDATGCYIGDAPECLIGAVSKYLCLPPMPSGRAANCSHVSLSYIHPGAAVVFTGVAVLSLDETSSCVAPCAASTGSASLSVLSLSASR